MRREIWLSALAGMVVGSWLTLIGVQFEIRGWIGLAQPQSKAADSGPAMVSASPPAPGVQPVASGPAAQPAPAPITATAPPAEVAKTTEPTAAAPAAGSPVASVAPSASADAKAASASAETPVSTDKADLTTAGATPVAPAEGSARPSPQPQQTVVSHSADKPTATVASGDNPPETLVTSATSAAPPPAQSPSAIASVPPGRPHGSSAAKPAYIAIPTPRPESPSEIAAAHVVAAALGHPGKDEILIEPIKATGRDPAATAQQSLAEPAVSTMPSGSAPAPASMPAPSAAPETVTAPSASDETADAAKKSDRQPQPSAATPDGGAAVPAPDNSATGTPQPQQQTKTVQLVHPFSDRAGVLTIGGRSIQLSGVIPTDTNRICTDPNGKTWPCGVLARTALRMFLRGRTVDCDMPEPAGQDGVVASCRYAKTDLSDWLVRNGWAEPAAGSSLADANKEAQEQKRGIYGSDPRKGGKSTLAPPPAVENPLNPI